MRRPWVDGAARFSVADTGIGLALVKELVALHGFAVEVPSEPGKGSCFTVTLRGGAAHLPPESLTATGAAASGTRVAAPFIAEALNWLPEAALAAPPELVLSDVMMPRLDGFGLLRPAQMPRRCRRGAC